MARRSSLIVVVVVVELAETCDLLNDVGSMFEGNCHDVMNFNYRGHSFSELVAVIVTFETANLANILYRSST